MDNKHYLYLCFGNGALAKKKFNHFYGKFTEDKSLLKVSVNALTLYRKIGGRVDDHLFMDAEKMDLSCLKGWYFDGLVLYHETPLPLEHFGRLLSKLVEGEKK